jgi:hypothetical protein|tara:strand:- start:620 stop:1000 length:381 start_codon:yes stop_codon:yes gene_type:complete
MSFLTKMLGLDKIKEVNEAKEQEKNKQLSPKELATKKKEPWVGVLQTHVNKENVRNGFFELDWNRHFVLQLVKEGYGVENDKEEEIIDRWFRELCANVVVDGDYGGPLEGMATGNIDIDNIKRDNK